jgi:acyl-CoA thioester hydrolase
MQRIYRWEFPIPSDAIDANGHVNNVRFVQWMQDVAIAHAASSGGSAAAEAAGGTWFARSHHIEYLKEAFEHDRIVVLTWIVDFARARSRRRFRFFRAADRALLARAETEWVFVDAATSRPRSIPESVIACFEAVGDEEIELD